MRCPRCDCENRTGAKFCNECAAPLPVHCDACGAENRPGANFCDACGTSLATPSAASSRQQPEGVTLAARALAPIAYTPAHLTEKIRHATAALAGERKQVTVLFADLKGSMELLADRDPEEARQLLDPVLERLMAAVHRYEGTVNQVMGDGIMALFGAPIAHEDHAVRACYAALGMQEAMRRYSEEVRRTQGIEVQIRVGLNSGEVVVRTIASDLHMDYTAVGQTTHLAARMEQLAPPRSIRLTVETLRLAEGFVQVTALGPVPVKGLAEPVEVFELVGAGLARTRLQAASTRGLTRFVGRDAELAALHQVLEQAVAGHGQVVALVGEPGVGKSRLVYECTRSHRTQGWLVLESSSVSYGKATPYLPVIDLLKAYCGIEARDDPRRRREKALGKVLGLDEALRPTLPAILALFEVPVDEPQWQALDPPQRRQRTLDAVKRLLLRESQVQPLLVVCEDLHWIDAETQAFLDSLVESLPTARLLLLVNYRPEYQHAWGHKTYYTQLRLDPLPPTRADELLQALLGDDPSLTPLTRLLIERTEGNPFFLEESARTLMETGVLVGTPGAYRLAQDVTTFQVPATVLAVLAARIDRLSPEDKRLLQSAAVIGKDVPAALLYAIAEVPEATLHHSLARLQGAEFLYETRLFPEPEYTFKHALTHETAYGSLLQEQRRVLHAHIADAMATLYADHLTEQVEHLAHHALRGEVWDKALMYCRQAGDKAMARSAHSEAAGYFEQALSALSRLPEQRDTRAQAIDLRLDLYAALTPSADLRRILAALHEDEALAAALDDRRRLGQVLLVQASRFILMGAYAQGITAVQRALALATADEHVGLHALAHFSLGAAYGAQGDYRRAIDCFGQTVASLEGAQRHELFGRTIPPAVNSRAELASCHAELGTFAEGRALGEEGLRIAETVDHPASLMVTSLHSGWLFFRQGDLPRALPLLERAVGLCQDADILVFFPWTAAALGAAYTLDGRIAEAVPLLTQAMEQATAMELIIAQARCRLSLGEAHLLAGRLEDAHALAEGALAHARAYQERGNEAYALHLLGEVAMHRDPPEVMQAEAHYRQALALTEALGMRPLQAHCHRGLGTLYVKSGQPEPARPELSVAIALYRDMDMIFWLHQAEAVLVQGAASGVSISPRSLLQ